MKADTVRREFLKIFIMEQLRKHVSANVELTLYVPNTNINSGCEDELHGTQEGTIVDRFRNM
jgi:hypothetical protein